jgi:hypothetical protein
MRKNHIQLNTDTFDSYIKHLKGMDYDSLMNGAAVIVRQVANDLKDVYMSHTPKRQSGGRTGKYGALPGNLQRSLRVFPKRRRTPFVVEFSVGYKKFQNLAQLSKAGSRAFDGHYDFMLNQGDEGMKAGRPRNKPKHEKPSQPQGSTEPNRVGKKKGSYKGFIQRARVSANRVIDGELSQRATDFIHKRMAKDLGWKAPQNTTMNKAMMKKYAA